MQTPAKRSGKASWAPAYTVAKTRLSQLRRRFNELCRAAGMQRSSVSDVLSGRSSNRRTQQLLTNLLGVQLFDDVRPSECAVLISGLTKLTCFSFESDGKESIEFGGLVERIGQTITFLGPTRVVLRFPELDQNPKNQPLQKIVEADETKQPSAQQRTATALENISEVPAVGSPP